MAGIVHTGEKSYFISAMDTGTNKKTADYCVTQARDTMKIAFGCNVTAVATDNEKKKDSMYKNLKEDTISLTVYGCSSHWLNLLGQDVCTKSFEEGCLPSDWNKCAHHTNP